MALIIADRVKETTITQGTGTITLSGSTFGGFQSFSDAIGEGNSTYYCIQNESNFEIGIGTFSSGSLSRDTILESSNSDAKISIVGTAVVFCVIPSQKLIFKDENNNVTLPQDLTIDDLSVDYISAASGDFSGPLTSNSFSSSLVSANDIIATDSLNSSGLLTLRRESAGNFFHAYIDDSNDRTISLYSDGLTPTWRLGLKSSPSSETEAPSYGYIYASDGEFGIVGNMNNKVTMSNATPFCVQHQGQNIIQAHYLTGVHLDSMTSAFPALVVNGGISLSANIQEWDTYDGTTLSVVDNQGFFGIRNDNPSYQLDVTGTGSFSQAVRFGDGTLQTTAGIPYASGSLIDQNAANLISQSGYFQSYVDIKDAAISGNLQSQINQNISDISATSGYFESRVDFADSSITANSGYFESRVDSADSSITANSGYFESRVDSADSSITANSGYFESRVDSADSSITANSGYFESRTNDTDNNLNIVSGLLTPSGESFDFTGNILTYNNSDGGSFTTDLSSLSTFDTSGVSLAYSAGTLTYTNNAGGSFGVDISSISGDVYALIVDGAPTTLDTLNEIAAALNDDDNIATTLTNLISTTSGNLQTQITSNDGDITQINSDIATVSGIASKTFTVTASSSTNYTFDGMGLSSAADPTIYLHKGHTYYFDKQTSSHPFRISASDGGSVYQDADGNNIEINGQGILTFEVPQNAPDKLYYYCTAHPSSMKGIIYTTPDGSLSGYFESRVDTADSNISSNSSNITANSGYFESRVDQADSDILAVSGLIGGADFLPGSSGGLIDQNTEDITTVSGLLASVNPTGTPSGISFFDDAGSLSGNSSLVFDGQNITLDGYIDASGQRVITSEDIHHIVQLTQAEYDAITPDSATFYIITDAGEDAAISGYFESQDTAISGYFESRTDQADSDIATVSGLLASVNPTGTPSGISFFDDSGSLSGNNTFIYDGADVSLSGNITASGKRVITSEEVHHIQKLTQSEYDALTPDAATFYIITDPDVEGPVVQPYREVSTSTSILSTDYTINATAGLTLSLPSAAGNGGIIFNIKNTGTGNVVVSGVGGNTIDGQPSFEISTQYQSIKVQSTNSNWIIL